MQIVISPPQFSDWPALLDLLRTTYAYMGPRINPPSSLVRMGIAEFQEKARHEEMILALESSRILGCAFAAVREDCVYVGKLAVDASARKRGVARRLMEAAESIARRNGKACLELETRIELLENHETFAALGFIKVAETAHPGFDRPTAITMRKPVAPEPN
jgi:GNAT superfamily N-acetyltransferase